MTIFNRSAALKGALLMTGSTYFAYVLGLLVSILVARSLGPDDFGRYSYVVWLSGLLVVLANHGLTTTGIRFVSESLGRNAPDQADRVHGHLRRWQLGSLLIVLASFSPASAWLLPAGWHGRLGLFLSVVTISVAAKTWYLFDVSIAKGHGRYAIEAAATVAATGANAVCAVVLVALGAPLSSFLWLFAAAGVAYAVIAVAMLRRQGVRAAPGDLDSHLHARLRAHLGWTLLLVLVAAFSNKSIETLLLNRLAGPAAVGFFTIAAGLTRGGVDMLSSGLSTVLMPSMAHAYGAGGVRRVAPILSDSVRYFQFFGLLLAGVGALWASPAINLLYGSHYGPVIPVFRIMVVVGGLTLADGAFGALLSTTDHQRLRAGIAVFAVACSAAAAFALVPRYGLDGAIAAHAVSRLTVYVVLVAGIVRATAVRLPWRELAMLLAAAAGAAVLAGIFLWIDPGLPMQAIAGIIYGLAFCAFTMALNAWQQHDIAHLRALAARLPALAAHLDPLLEQWQGRLPVRQ